ncbi:MAG: S-layer homology domain-containing protein [Firmicutes bacterium]|nr:S-layer homology domain-containing protein [Bacillota bacterium]
MRALRTAGRAGAALVLLLILSAAFASPSFAEAGFTDVREGYWAIPYIGLAKSSGLIEGYVLADGSAEFRPERNVTKQECLVMLYNTLKLAGALSEDPVPEYSGFYEDYDPTVTGEPRGIPAWAREFVSYALSRGICSEDDFSTETDADGRSGGYSYASRQLIAKWTSKALGCEEAAFFRPVYEDSEDADPGMLVYMDALYRHGIMQGNKGMFYPKNGVKRSEMATICTRLLGVKADEAAGAVTDYGMLREDGSFIEGSSLYDSAKYLDSLKLSDRMLSFSAELVSAGKQSGILTFKDDGGTFSYVVQPGTDLVLDGTAVDFPVLAGLEGETLNVSCYAFGEPAVVIQTAPAVRSGSIISLKDRPDHKLLNMRLEDNTRVSFVLTSESLTQGELKKDRSCRFIADGIVILEMR